jgi:hypothetical protein
MPKGKLVSLAVTGANALTLKWDDGHVARVGLGEVIAGHAGLRPIRATKAFAKAKLSKDGWSVEWPGGIDFGSPQLRRWADEQSGEAMPAADFRRWMEAHERFASAGMRCTSRTIRRRCVAGDCRVGCIERSEMHHRATPTKEVHFAPLNAPYGSR